MHIICHCPWKAEVEAEWHGEDEAELQLLTYSSIRTEKKQYDELLLKILDHDDK